MTNPDRGDSVAPFRRPKPNPTPPMPEQSQPSLIRLVLLMGLFVVFGGPTTYFLWHELSDLLYGRIEEVEPAVLLGSLVVFLVLLWVLRAFVRSVAESSMREENP